MTSSTWASHARRCFCLFYMGGFEDQQSLVSINKAQLPHKKHNPHKVSSSDHHITSRVAGCFDSRLILIPPPVTRNGVTEDRPSFFPTRVGGTR